MTKLRKEQLIVGKKSNNGGRIALSGYIFQTLYAIILSMKEEWELIKVEPLTAYDKTDIMLLKNMKYSEVACDGVDIQLSGNKGLCKIIQVKKRTDPVTQSDLDKWCDSILQDGQEFRSELCLFGKLKDNVKIDNQRVHVIIFDNDIEETESMVKKEIANYCNQKDAAGYSEKDLNDAYEALFLLLMMNSIKDKPVSKEEVDEKLKAILESSPDNRAAIIKLTSNRYFYENPDYIRDLKPARLDGSGKCITMNQRLCSHEFPEVQEGINKSINFAEYFKEHVKDASIARHIYLSGTSGSGKSTCIYDLWEQLLDDNNKYIPIYVPFSAVTGSVNEYITDHYLAFAGIDDFNWLKKDLKKSAYYIVMLLDGYNELTEENNAKLDKEISVILNMERVTVVISSRDPKKEFEKSMTRLKMCPLSKMQISRFLGGNKEILDKRVYEGVLTNPFMLEICIKTYAGNVSEKLSSIGQVSMEMMLQEYITKQIKEDYLSNINRIYLNVILPLVTMKLDRRKKEEEISEDSKFYKWDDFNKAVKSVQKGLNMYERSIHYCIWNKHDNVDCSIDTIKKKSDLATSIVTVGTELEIFNHVSKNGKIVKWDHEIYRDYFAARGYVLYALAHKDSENCIYKLAEQVNYRYPEPEDSVDEAIRGYHVQKVQMFIDMVDAKLSNHDEFIEDDFKKLKKTATYRRLVRDVAFIYEDLNDIKMGEATDLCMKYYSNKLKIYDRHSKHDYKSKMRRYADAAYSLSGLAFNYTHLKPVEDDPVKEKEYLNKAKDALQLSESIFKILDSSIKKNSTVSDDMIKYNGNCAAYNLAMYRIEKDKKYVSEALKAHTDNLNLRLAIRKKNGETKEIMNNIAVSYSGIATCNYYLGEYDEAIKNHSLAIDVRTKINRQNKKDKDKNNYISRIYNSYRRIVGCFAEIKEYTPDNALLALEWIIKTLNYANDNNTLQDYEKMSGEIKCIMQRIPLSVKQSETYIQSKMEIDSLMEKISGKSINA